MFNSEIPSGWTRKRLSDLGEINRGRSRHRPRYAPHLYGGPYPFIQTGDVKSSQGRITEFEQTYSEEGLAQSRLWPAETMCITIAANIAETAILKFPACFPDSVVGFIPDNTKCDVYYIEYVFRFLKTSIQRQASGSVQDNINIGTLEETYFPIPNLPEQKAIAQILGTLDDKIELNRQTNKTLEAMARAIFKSWFVDFDPVHAKRAARDGTQSDTHTAALSLSPDILDLFPDSFQDSELGEIPAGWEVQSVAESCEINPRRQLKKGDVATYLDMKNMPTDGPRASALIKREMNSGSKFINGDTLLARITPCLENGKTAYVDFLEESEVGWGSTEYIVIRPKPPLPLEFGYFLARDDSFRDHAILNMTGSSGRQRVQIDCFENYKIAIPNTGVCERFKQETSVALQKIKNTDQESEHLSELRDALLPKLISGELRIKDAEKFLKEAPL